MTTGDDDSHRAWKPTKSELAISTIGGILFVVEIFICFFLYYNSYSLEIILYVGWFVLMFGLIMMSLPRITLQKYGNPPNGKSWVHTTMLVDSGIYAIVRHPLYVGWMLDIIALMLISQHLYTLIIGIIPFLTVYHFVRWEDKSNRDKFGETYIEYSERVPMVNFILGLVRFFRRD